MTWDEIRARYPDEWVVLVDLRGTRDDGEFETALVLHHAPDRKASLRDASPVQRGFRQFAHEFTGRYGAPRSASGEPG